MSGKEDVFNYQPNIRYKLVIKNGNLYVNTFQEGRLTRERKCSDHASLLNKD